MSMLHFISVSVVYCYCIMICIIKNNFKKCGNECFTVSEKLSTPDLSANIFLKCSGGGPPDVDLSVKDGGNYQGTGT